MMKQTKKKQPPQYQSATNDWSVVWPLAAAIIALLMGPMLLGFSQVMPDTFSYLGDALNHNFYNAFRPVWYGYFLSISWQQTLWIATVSQAIITVAALYFAIHVVFPTSNIVKMVCVALVFLAFTTGASDSVTRLVPDFMIVVMFSGIVLQLLGTKLEHKIVGALAIFAGIITHHSHLPISILVVGAAYLFLRKKSLAPGGFRRLTLTLVITIASIPALNMMMGGSFNFSNTSSAFLMNRANDFGLVQKYIDDTCASNDQLICSHSGKIPPRINGFLWSGGKVTPFLEKIGGRLHNDYIDKLSKEILLMYPLEFGIGALKGAKDQLLSFGAIGTSNSDYKYLLNSSKFREALTTIDISGLDRSVANRGLEKSLSSFLNIAQLIVLVISLFLAPWLWLSCRDEEGGRIRVLIFLATALVFVNALVCGGLNGVYPRLQERVVWLFCFSNISVGFILLKRYIDVLKLAKKNNLKNKTSAIVQEV